MDMTPSLLGSDSDARCSTHAACLDEPTAANHLGRASSGDNRAGVWTPFPRHNLERSITEVFADIVRGSPEKVAVRSATEVQSYRELNQVANGLGRAILSHCDPTRRPVAFMVRQGNAAIATILGILKARGVYTPLDPESPDIRLRHILKDSDATMIVADRHHRARLDSLLAAAKNIKLIDFDCIEPCSDPELPLTAAEADLPCSLLYTSSSTGAPKGVVQTHRNVLHCVLRYTNGCRLSASDRFLLLASTSFAASVPDVFTSLLVGGTLLCYSIHAGGLLDLAQWIEQERATIYHSVPSLFRRFARGLSGHDRFPALRLITLGGEPVLKSDVELFNRCFCRTCRLNVGLGSTETHVVRRFLIDHGTAVSSSCVPVGYPVEDVEVEVLDEEGRPVPPDRPGEIVVMSRYLAVGYWNQPDLTRASFSSDTKDPGLRRFRTGDLGMMRPDGCLMHLGRKDSQVKIRGVRAHVAEVEAVLLGLGRFEEAAIVPVQHDGGEWRLVAYLTPGTPELTPALRSELREVLAAALPEAMIPSAFIQSKDLPRTSTGKLDRRALANRPVEWAGAADGESTEAPSRAQELVLLELFEKVLGTRKARLEDSFHGLGGTSLQALEMAKAIETDLCKVIPWRELVRAQSIRHLSAMLDSLEVGARLTLLAANACGFDGEPLFCVPGLFFGIELLRPVGEGLSHGRASYALEYGIEPRIEALGRVFVNKIKQIRPHGPYHLVGHSFGGWIAYEAARLLRASGDRVGLVILLDTRGPGFPRSIVSWPERQLRRWRRLKKMASGDLINHIRDRTSAFFRRPASEPETAKPRAMLSVAWQLISQDLHRERASYLSRIAPYAGPLVLLRASMQEDSDVRSSEDRCNGLSPFAPGGLRIIEVPGDHTAMLDAPELVSTIAGLMKCRPAVACSAGPTRDRIP
jgi:amino acid adenylation domain-containing protein